MSKNPGKRLLASFYQRPTDAVARGLLGKCLVHGERSGIIVETEAYTRDDPASHSRMGPTPRNRPMFEGGGLAYVYFVYGMHFCANISCQQRGIGAAVLLRALEPTAGIDEMAARRGTTDPRLLCSGPARLAQALGISRDANGALVAATASPASGLATAARVRARPGDAPQPVVAAAPRIGVNDDGRPWRFVEAASPFVSRPLPRSGAASSRG